ncbi:hypothetical protein BY458DRAFT_553068 [Sporodiniella umbellata]|nr:hypothetical protein BY458DRAFT_553068 [Sporodiniella umbellata]
MGDKDKSLSVDRYGFLQVLDKYTNLGIYIVHHSFTLAELFALSGLHFTSQTIQSGLMAAEESVGVIDGIFGSNESSRAIASIITLAHKELLRDPNFKLAQNGKTAILSGLTKAITSFAILQNFTHSRTLHQMKIVDLWKGVVIEEEKEIEKSEKSSTESENKEIHPDIINEIENIMSNQPSENEDAEVPPEPEQNIVSMRFDHRGEPYRVYEVTTNIKRTTTKTTRIKPIDLQGNEQHQAKQIVEKTSEEGNEAFMAVVNPSQESEGDQELPGSWPGDLTPKKKTGFRIMLASVSKALARKKVERQETYGTVSQDNLLEPTFQGPLTTIASTSTTTRSALSTNAHNGDPLQDPTVPNVTDEPVKKTKSWMLQRKKSVSNLFQMGADALSNKKKKARSEIPPLPSLPVAGPPPTVNNSVSSNRGLQRSNSFHSTTSLSSLVRTTKTTTYTSRPSSFHSSRQSLLDVEPHSGNFPRKHLVTNISHFIRYASAAYGESFMRILGIGDIPTVLPNSYHPNHHAFAHHTGVSVSDILLSSYTDSSIFTTVSHTKLHALVHYVTVDHFARAIVLTCRGTLGLGDVLTDLTCGYKDFVLPSDPYDPPKKYMAHAGMLEAAQMLAVQKGKVFESIKRGLEAHPEYGLVVCGHSLGAGVASLLSVLWSEKKNSFVTSVHSGLPSGRPMHCYTYGSPCVMSFALSEYCGQGLVTSVVHGSDIVSCLSLGLLRDFKNIAVSLYEESHVADEILSRMMNHYQKKKTNEITLEQEENDQWFWALIKTMRADMKAEKLFPPSNVYLVESIPQLAQHSQSRSQTSHGSTQKLKHKIAYSVRFSQCKDIQARFSEIMFSRTMFMDHSPKMYEKSISLLNKGYFD